MSELVGKVGFSLTIPDIPFSQGKYSLSIGFSDKTHGTLFRNQSVVHFTVHGKAHGWTPIQFSPALKIKGLS